MEAGAGTYPLQSEKLGDQLAHLFNQYPSRQISPEAVILPHGPFKIVAPIAAATVSSLAIDNIRRIILLSSLEIKKPACYTEENFKTPLKSTNVDNAFLTQLQLESAFEKDKKPFQRSGRYHAPLVFFQYLIDTLDLVPLCVSDTIANETMRKLVKSLKQTMNDTDLLVVSGKLTSHTETSHDPAKTVHKNDSRFISMLENTDYTSILKEGKKLGLDSIQAFAMCCALVGRRKLAVIDHTVAYDDETIRETATGYGGMIFT